MAIDLDLDQPVLLSVTVSVHHCPACQHYFRAQPPLLRPDATYSQRVMQKAIQAVHDDGMAMRRVPERLARDFWVAPSEGMVRLWCKAQQAAFDFETDYQRWVVSEFSGILCVDEVYQDQLALLLAVDPAAADGDRLVGYQLVHGRVDGTISEGFLCHLREAGVQPDEVITDGSALYPSVLAKVWPAAAHQLCLFHETRRVTKAAMELIQTARSALPTPPPHISCSALQGRLPDQPPSDNPEDPANQRWQLRRAMRQAGIAQVHALAQQGFSLRSIARQLSMHRQTVKKWLQCQPSAEVPADLAENWRRRTLPDVDALRRAQRQIKHEQVHRLAQQGLSYAAIARQVGLCRVTVKRWLLLDLPSDLPLNSAETELSSNPSSQAEEASDRQGSMPEARSTAHFEHNSPDDKSRATQLPPPPAPWTGWDQVDQVREALREHRFLLLRCPEHLNADQEAQVSFLVHCPLPQLRVARSFLLDWYNLWKDAQGLRRTLHEARSRYEAWRSNATYRAESPLRRVLDQMTDAHFEQLGSFLRNPRWEATNNGAERAGRAFRHDQAPHFNLRTEESIEGALIVAACQRKTATRNGPLRQANRATRGRQPLARAPL
jgi:transposase-like protein